MGLIVLEGQNWTARELLFIIGAIMLFVLLAIVLLKVYVIPAYGIGITIKKFGVIFSKIKNANIFK